MKTFDEILALATSPLHREYAETFTDPRLSWGVGVTQGVTVAMQEAQAEIDALKSERDALLAAQQWRDIESAPKDEESVLILFGEADVVVVAHWDGDNECWCESWLGDELNNGHAKKWRPLLQPPAIAKARGDL